MTPLQLKALDFVRERIAASGLSPTIEEIRDQLDLCGKGRAHAVVSALVELGHLARVSNRPRGLRLAGVPDLRGTDSAVLIAELHRRGDMPGAFSEPERRAMGRRDVACAATCCAVAVTPGKAFRRDHWFAIPETVREALLSAHAAARRVRSGDTANRYQEAFYNAREHADRLGRRAG